VSLFAGAPPQNQGDSSASQTPQSGGAITQQSRQAAVPVQREVLAFLLLLRWRWPHAPGPLLAVLLATAAVTVFGLGRHGVRTVGPIPAGLPVPLLPEVDPRVLRELLLPAFTVLVVGFSDDVLTAGRSPGGGRRSRPTRSCWRSASPTPARACCAGSPSAAARPGRPSR